MKNNSFEKEIREILREVVEKLEIALNEPIDDKQYNMYKLGHGGGMIAAISTVEKMKWQPKNKDKKYELALNDVQFELDKLLEK